MKKMLIDEQVVQALLQYLQARPFGEVAQIIQVLSQLEVHTIHKDKE
jgi:hypothetical protein